MSLAIHDIVTPEARPAMGAGGVVEFALVLLPGFALMSYAAFVESFRAANALAGRELYRWRHVSLDGAPVAASNGAVFLVDQGLAGELVAQWVVVFAAGDPARIAAPGLSAWLRQQDRAGKIIAGVSAGPWLLARAGLLHRSRATIHWDHRDGFEQDFPEIDHVGALFVRDGRRITCAGGMAGMDLAAGLIEEAHGKALADRVGAWFIHPGPRSADRPQRPGLDERYRGVGARVLSALAAMEANLDEPLTREALAGRAGVAIRQLERLFHREIGAGIAAHYLRLRLDRAAELLRNTRLSATEIALACGFRSSSHFSRAFRDHFGLSPTQARGAEGIALSAHRA